VAKILVVDDDEKMRNSLHRWLKKEGHETELAITGEDALQMLSVYKFDIVVLDWGLPDISGLQVLNRFRAMGGNTPIIFLTGKGDVASKKEGLDAGADDYLPKPFAGEELSARIRAIMRRPQGLLPSLVCVGNIALDLSTKGVTKDGVPVKLGKKEYAILEFLLRHPNQHFLAKDLMDRIWPSDTDTNEDAVRSCVRQLRMKIGDEDGKCIITNTQGAGYAINME
jgi:DNA-binding response OmpR family regulator